MEKKKLYKLLTLLLVLMAGVTAVFTLTKADSTHKVTVGKVVATEDEMDEVKVPVHFDNPNKDDFSMLTLTIEYDPEALELDRAAQGSIGKMKFLNDDHEVKDENDQPTGKREVTLIYAMVEEDASGNPVYANFHNKDIAELYFVVNKKGKHELKVTSYTFGIEKNGAVEEMDLATVDGSISVENHVDTSTVKVADGTSFNFDMSGTKTGKLVVEYLPADTSDPMNLQVTGCEDYIDVDANGNVTAKANTNGAKTCTVKAFGVNAGTFTVSVITSISGVSLNETDVTLNKGEDKTLVATVSPATTSAGIVRTVSWTSSKPEVATVDNTGKVTAVGKGTAVITATTSNQKTATATVKVVVPLSSFTLTPSGTVELNKNESKTVTINPDPADASIEDVVWTSSDAAVEVVKNTANPKEATITGKAGKTGVIVKAKIGNKEQTITVNVNVPITGIEVTPAEDVKILPGQSVNYAGTILPADNTEGKTIAWSVENPESVEVIELQGNKIVAKNPGTATVTAKVTANSGVITKTINVKVLIPINNIVINKADVKLANGASEQLSVKVYPEEAEEEIEASWTSSKPEVATVDNTGKVTATGVGTTTIKVTANGKEATSTVTVFNKVQAINVVKNAYVINRGATDVIEASVNPENATNSTITWVSKNPEVVTINTADNKKPVITAVERGTAEIEGKIVDVDGTVKTVTVTVTVKVPITAVQIKKGETVVNNETIELVKVAGAAAPSVSLTAVVLPADTTEDKKVTWGVENPEDTDVITVDEDGTVIGLNGGYAYVTAKAGSVTSKVRVYVKVPINKFELVKDKDTVLRKSSTTLKAVIEPQNTTENTTITWSSNNNRIAKVDENGVVTGMGEGTTTIVGRLENGLTVEAEITVKIIEVEDIKFANDEDEELESVIAYRTIDKSIASLLKVYPFNATETSDITWSSSAEDIVKVDAEGKLVPLKVGKAVITAVMGDHTATIEVEVKEIKLESISLKERIDKIKVGSVVQLEIVKNPTNSTEDVTFTYESSDNTIVKIDENGKLSAVGVGSATITIKASNGVKVSYNVTVEGAESPNTGVKTLVPYGISSLVFLSGIVMTIRKLRENEITLM